MRRLLTALFPATVLSLLALTACKSGPPEARPGLLAAVMEPKTMLWGYIDTRGEWVLQPTYGEASPFEGSWAAVRPVPGDSTLWTWIDPQGKEHLRIPGLLSATSFQHGKAMVRRAGEYHKFRFIDMQGNYLPLPAFTSIYLWEDGPFPLMDSITGKLGYVDTTGKWVIPPQFTVAPHAFEGRPAVPVKIDSLWAYVDAQGKFLAPPQFSFAYPFFEGRAVVKDMRGGRGYVDAQGQYFPAPAEVEDMAEVISEDMIGVKKNRRWGFMNPKYEWLLEPKFVYLASSMGQSHFMDGRVIMAQKAQDTGGRRLGFVDKQGQWCIPPDFIYLRPFQEGLAIALDTIPGDPLLLGYIDTTGQFAIGKKFLKARAFSKAY